MPKSGGSSFIKAMKRGGPGQGGARTIIGQLGDSFPRFDVTRDVWSAPDEPSLANEGHIQYTKVHPVYPQPDDIQNKI